MNNRNSYRVRIENGYCAGSATKLYLKPGESSAGREVMEGWGSTPKAAEHQAKHHIKRSGNCNVEWVLSHRQVWKNGTLISESY